MFSSLVSPRERLFQFFVQRKTFLLFGKLREFLRPMSMRRGCIDVRLSIRRAISRHCTARTGMVADAASSLTTASGRAMWWSQ